MGATEILYDDDNMMVNKTQHCKIRHSPASLQSAKQDICLCWYTCSFGWNWKWCHWWI